MKIVHCTFSFALGGIESMLVDILNEQVKTNDVALVVLNDHYRQEMLDLIDKRVRIVLLHRRRESKSIVPILRLNYRLWCLHPDVVHVHISGMLPLIRCVSRRKLLLTAHAMQIVKNPKHIPVIAISDAVKEALSRRYPDVDVTTVANGIDIESIDKKDLRTKSTPFRIVQVGRLAHETKGHDILIRAIALLTEQGLNNIEVDFIGKGPSKAELCRLADESGLNDRIHFFGLQERRYVYTHLKDYDLMCQPSRREGFGLTVAEGMAAKLPVLVSTGEGPYEIIEHGKYGACFENGNVEDCARAIRAIYEDYDAALSLVDAAYEHVKAIYSIQRMVASYMEVYRQMLS